MTTTAAKTAATEIITVTANGTTETWEVPVRRSQYLDGYLKESLWRRTASKEQLGRKQSTVTTGTYVGSCLSGRAKN